MRADALRRVEELAAVTPRASVDRNSGPYFPYVGPSSDDLLPVAPKGTLARQGFDSEQRWKQFRRALGAWIAGS